MIAVNIQVTRRKKETILVYKGNINDWAVQKNRIKNEKER